MPKNISISNHVYEALKQIKERENHTSYDSVIRTMLTKAGEL